MVIIVDMNSTLHVLFVTFSTFPVWWIIKWSIVIYTLYDKLFKRFKQSFVAVRVDVLSWLWFVLFLLLFIIYVYDYVYVSIYMYVNAKDMYIFIIIFNMCSIYNMYVYDCVISVHSLGLFKWGHIWTDSEYSWPLFCQSWKTNSSCLIQMIIGCLVDHFLA